VRYCVGDNRMKARYLTAAIPLFILMFSSIAYASLDVDISVENAEIIPLEDQKITATANERGIGVLLVLQPAEGTPWMDFLDAHPALKSLYNSLPGNIQTELANKIGGKIVSFKTVSFSGGGGSKTLTFPDDFTGINGAPSTEFMGKYKVIFAYMSWESSDNDARCCCLCELEFDCAHGGWFVIPEAPLGTVASLLGMFVAIPALLVVKRVKHK
jgi:hypothetical protein